MPQTKPDPIAAVAYLRRLPGMDTQAVQQVVKELVAFTEREGFALAELHYEGRPSQRLATWGDLIVACRSEGVATVLVPSADHFHQDAIVAAFMREELAEKIRGSVRYVHEDDKTTMATSEAGRHDH